MKYLPDSGFLRISQIVGDSNAVPPVTAVIPGGQDKGTYVPAQARADGGVSPGYFVARPAGPEPRARR